MNKRRRKDQKNGDEDERARWTERFIEKEREKGRKGSSGEEPLPPGRAAAVARFWFRLWLEREADIDALKLHVVHNF